MGSWKRHASILAVVVLTLGVLAAASMMIAEGSLRVRRHAPGFDRGRLPVGTAVREVSLSARDGAKLDPWLFESGGQATRCVMVMHGIADSRSGAAGFAPSFLNAGYTVLAPDSRGHGTSGGDLVTYGLLEKYDAAGWARWLQDLGCKEIYGLGESLGAAVLIQAAGIGAPLRAIVAECSYVDLPTIAEFRVAMRSGMPSFLATPAAKLLVSGSLLYVQLQHRLDLRDASPLDALRRTSTPILFIHGMSDAETPPSHSIHLAETKRGSSLWLVPTAGHAGASTAAPEEFQRRVLAWFEQH